MKYDYAQIVTNLHMMPLKAGIDIEKLEGFEVSRAMHDFMVHEYNSQDSVVCGSEESLEYGKPLCYMGMKISVNEEVGENEVKLILSETPPDAVLNFGNNVSRETKTEGGE